MTPFSLYPKPPFDFAHSLEAAGKHKADATEKTVEDGSLWQALLIQGRAVVVHVETLGSVEAPELRCELFSTSEPTPEVLDGARRHLETYLGLEDDLGPFYALAAADDAFAPVLARLYGYHLLRFPSVFASVCWALVTQRTPNPFAYATMRRLIDALGERVESGGRNYTTFPEPHSFLASGAAAKILEATNNTRKTERLIPLARRFLEVDETFLQRAPYEEVFRWLKTLPGLGSWSAEYVMLRGLGRSERSPWTDTGLLEAISQVYTQGFQISRGDARRLAESYGWYQGWWVHYLKTVML